MRHGSAPRDDSREGHRADGVILLQAARKSVEFATAQETTFPPNLHSTAAAFRHRSGESRRLIFVAWECIYYHYSFLPSADHKSCAKIQPHLNPACNVQSFAQ